MSLSKRGLTILAVVFFAGMVAACDATSVSTVGPTFTETGFIVPAGERHTVAVTLQSGRMVEGSFGISGAADSIDFYVNGPDRELVFGVVRAVGAESFEVKAAKSGTYSLVFDNSISFSVPRQVSLRYRTR